MAQPPAQTPPPPGTDLRSLGLVALHGLAQQGNAAARAELDRRMRSVPAAGGLPAARAGAPPSVSHPPEPGPVDTAAHARAGRLQLMAQLAPERDPAGPPRLVGLVMLAWGILLTLGGLTLLVHAANAYYVFCGLACAAVGHLLMRCSWWAAHAHVGLLALALVWGWQSDASVLGALAGALPLLAPLLWLAVPAIRAPLR